MFRVVISCSDGLVFGDNLRNDTILDGRIVGGEPIDITQVPYQVSVQIYGYHNCGGSILNQLHVLTAAHCTSGLLVSIISVRVGSSTTNESGQVIEVERITNHPDYNRLNYDYDYSVLKLKNPLQYFDSVQAISLPSQGQQIPDGTQLLVTGWGSTEFLGFASDTLQGVVVPKTSMTYCRNSLGSFRITDRMFCAGYPDGVKDACQGDSGGPAVSNGVLVGVISWGDGCASADKSGVYALVSAVTDWIQSKMN
ncbi:trypsin [Sergentomyia squamirostris]